MSGKKGQVFKRGNRTYKYTNNYGGEISITQAEYDRAKSQGKTTKSGKAETPYLGTRPTKSTSKKQNVGSGKPIVPPVITGYQGKANERERIALRGPAARSGNYYPRKPISGTIRNGMTASEATPTQAPPVFNGWGVTPKKGGSVSGARKTKPLSPNAPAYTGTKKNGYTGIQTGTRDDENVIGNSQSARQKAREDAYRKELADKRAKAAADKNKSEAAKRRAAWRKAHYDPQVKKIQQEMYDAGIFTDKKEVDGLMGPKTRAAMSRYNTFRAKEHKENMAGLKKQAELEKSMAKEAAQVEKGRNAVANVVYGGNRAVADVVSDNSQMTPNMVGANQMNAPITTNATEGVPQRHPAYQQQTPINMQEEMTSSQHGFGNLLGSIGGFLGDNKELINNGISVAQQFGSQFGQPQRVQQPYVEDSHYAFGNPPPVGDDDVSGEYGWNESGQDRFKNNPTLAPTQGHTMDINTTVAAPPTRMGGEPTSTNPGGITELNSNPTLSDAVGQSGISPEQLNLDPALFRGMSPQEQINAYNTALLKHQSQHAYGNSRRPVGGTGFFVEAADNAASSFADGNAETKMIDGKEYTRNETGGWTLSSFLAEQQAKEAKQEAKPTQARKPFAYSGTPQTGGYSYTGTPQNGKSAAEMYGGSKTAGKSAAEMYGTHKPTPTPTKVVGGDNTIDAHNKYKTLRSLVQRGNPVYPGDSEFSDATAPTNGYWSPTTNSDYFPDETGSSATKEKKVPVITKRGGTSNSGNPPSPPPVQPSGPAWQGGANGIDDVITSPKAVVNTPNYTPTVHNAPKLAKTLLGNKTKNLLKNGWNNAKGFLSDNGGYISDVGGGLMSIMDNIGNARDNEKMLKEGVPDANLLNPVRLHNTVDISAQQAENQQAMGQANQEVLQNTTNSANATAKTSANRIQTGANMGAANTGKFNQENANLNNEILANYEGEKYNLGELDNHAGNQYTLRQKYYDNKSANRANLQDDGTRMMNNIALRTRDNRILAQEDLRYRGGSGANIYNNTYSQLKQALRNPNLDPAQRKKIEAEINKRNNSRLV